VSSFISYSQLFVKKFNRNIDLKKMIVPSIFKNSVYNRAFKRKATALAAIDVYGILHSLKTNPFFSYFTQTNARYIQKKNRPGR
jgi:hypothetical protein